MSKEVGRFAEALQRIFSERDTSKFNELDFVHAFGVPSAALLYFKLFWPDFVDIYDMTLMKSDVEDEEDIQRIRETLIRYDGDRLETQKSFNFKEIPYLFKRADLLNEDYMLLAKGLQETWQAKLNLDFPQVGHVVEVVPADDDDEVGLIFYRLR